MPEDSVKLGLMPPLSGLVAMYGQEISWAGQIACEEINEAGGVLGRPLELVIEDDGSLPDTAVPAAQRLVAEHGCHAIIGNLLSNSRIAVSDMVATPCKIPYLNFSFYEGSIFSRYFFHFAALPNQQIDKMIPYMAKHYGPKMFFAGSNYEWPRGSISAAKDALQRWGGEIVGEEYLPIGSPLIDELLDMVSKSGADVFVPYFAGQDQIDLLTSFTERGLKNHMNVVMGHYDEVMASILPPEVRSGFFSSNTYFMSIDSPENITYLQKLASVAGVSGIWPGGNGVLTNFGEGTYLCVKAFAKAAQQAGSLLPEDLVVALAEVEVKGPQGMVVMNPQSHHATVNTYLSRCNENGTFSIIEKFGLIEPVIPARYTYQEDKADSRHVDGPPAELDGRKSHIEQSGLSSGFKAGILIFDTTGRIVYANITADNIWGTSGRSDRLLVGGDITNLFCEPGQLWSQVQKLDKHWFGTLDAKLADGRCLEIDVTLNPYSQSKDCGFGYILTCVPCGQVDGTDSQILSHADVAVIATDDQGVIFQVNKHACALFGYRQNELLGISVHLLLPPHSRERHKKHLQGFVRSQTMERVMGQRADIAGYSKDGSIFPAEASISKFMEEGRWVCVVTLRDVTDRKKVEKELIWKATHDALTLLPNRDLIRDRLHNALQRSKRSGSNVALLFIDLDNFKLINDSYGHEAGDTLLVEVAERLSHNARPGDTVARFGGDEFIVLCEQVEEPVDVSSLAIRLNDALRQPFKFSGEDHIITSSIGIAIGHGATHSPEDMLRNADSAMYLAKDHGRDGWKFFNQSIHEQAKQRLSLAIGIRSAIEKNELSLHFQPIVEASSGKILGAEALLRWQKDDNFISPANFIPIAEMTGSILPIGTWVFFQACRYLAELNKIEGNGNFYVSVNVSTRQLEDEDIVENFGAAMEKFAVDPANLLIEITETSLMADVEENLKMLRQLSEIGLKVAVDDFGTGYSSLGQLVRMPVSRLKVDRIFIEYLDAKEEHQAVVSAIINMAHSLKLKVIAEGVETEPQLKILQKFNCSYIQGYYFYRPMPFADLLLVLKKDLK